MQQNQLLDCIDIRLVKEQLRLLGHEVTDDVILSFVKGLAGGAEQQRAAGSGAGTEGQDVQHAAAGRAAMTCRGYCGIPGNKCNELAGSLRRGQFRDCLLLCKACSAEAADAGSMPRGMYWNCMHTASEMHVNSSRDLSY
jgi:hypothetical protein